MAPYFRDERFESKTVGAKIDLIAISFNHKLTNQPSGRSTDGLRNGW